MDINETKQLINALKQSLGIVGTLKFLEHFDNGGSGDYTAEKYLEEDDGVVLTAEELLKKYS